jgi:hypothetical protein
MEERGSYAKLTAEISNRFSFVEEEFYLSISELQLVKEYLLWIREGGFGEFTATKYENKDSTYIDTEISKRNRNPLYILPFTKIK